MYVVIRRYEGVDESRLDEVMDVARDMLVPRLSEIAGFDGYYLIRAGSSVIASVGLFDNAAGAEESTRIAAEFIRSENLSDVIPNPPQVTEGEVVAHKATQALLA